MDEENALMRLEQGLKSDNMAYIYHSYDHYFCPIGYDITPCKQQDAYKPAYQIEK